MAEGVFYFCILWFCRQVCHALHFIHLHSFLPASIILYSIFYWLIFLFSIYCVRIVLFFCKPPSIPPWIWQWFSWESKCVQVNLFPLKLAILYNFKIFHYLFHSFSNFVEQMYSTTLLQSIKKHLTAHTRSWIRMQVNMTASGTLNSKYETHGFMNT